MKKIVISLFMIGLLSGCGVKPSHVDPPPGVTKDTFPKTYPNPATDPQPEKPAP